jgi:cytochrome c oxidase assembly factor CtaG
VTVQPTLAHLLGSWSFDPVVALVLLAATLAYGTGALTLRRRDRAWPPARAASFFAGLLALALALLSGIDALADELLSVHMVQHLLLALVAPALLLYGAPVRLALAAGSPAVRAATVGLLRTRAVRALAHPAVGCAVFASTVLVWHLTGLFELALRHPAVHVLEHAAYFWAGILLLAPLIAADPLPHRPGAVGRFCWMLAAMTAMAAPGALLTFAATLRYPFYAAPAHALGRSALADEHAAGAIMWVAGGVVMFALALAVSASAMLAEERRQRRRDLYAARSTAVGR